MGGLFGGGGANSMLAPSKIIGGVGLPPPPLPLSSSANAGDVMRGVSEFKMFMETHVQ